MALEQASFCIHLYQHDAKVFLWANCSQVVSSDVALQSPHTEYTVCREYMEPTITSV
jgi:hypothetical protein